MNYPPVLNIFKYMNLDDEAFWDFLTEEDVYIPGPRCLLAIESEFVKELIIKFINKDPDDPDNYIYLNLLNEYFKNYTEEYYVIGQNPGRD